MTFFYLFNKQVETKNCNVTVWLIEDNTPACICVARRDKEELLLTSMKKV